MLMDAGDVYGDDNVWWRMAMDIGDYGGADE